ncbi:hypothetical protein B0A48_04817 [Cryoendolithus antarcticus]|uniref:Uncharacterized protein n=1 Tax=Cryoendolithus antarcticus TaxID=1507870 RepID=A0A1V8TDF1_9PEZI|nr:hypothetical protein B0A48_04817 [Cryoendolithus antarcticus]
MPSTTKMILSLLAVAGAAVAAPGPIPTTLAIATGAKGTIPIPTEAPIYEELSLPDLYKRACYTTTKLGGQAPVVQTICPGAPVCSVCVGCNAPVTVCH